MKWLSFYSQYSSNFSVRSLMLNFYIFWSFFFYFENKEKNQQILSLNTTRETHISRSFLDVWRNSTEDKVEGYLRVKGRLRSTLGAYFFCFLSLYFSCKQKPDISLYSNSKFFWHYKIQIINTLTCENKVFFSNVALLAIRASTISSPFAPCLCQKRLQINIETS